MQKILVITGPTATGKSALAVEIAKVLAVSGVESEIISADSRQVYLGLDIGSAKITEPEMQGIPHHLIDVADPHEIFTVSEFQKLANEKIREIISRGKLPIICGGTGMYISSVIDGTKFPDVAPDMELRAELERQSTTELLDRLVILDPERAEDADRSNRPRLIRAIEIATALGSVPKLVKTDPGYDTLVIGLDLPKEELLVRISHRIESRIPALFDEIEKLLAHGVTPERLKSFGLEYRYGTEYIEGTLSIENFKEILATKTWQYVRRQMTWWKRDSRVQWLNPVSDKQKIIEIIQKYISST